jgi:hypothetical protein
VNVYRIEYQLPNQEPTSRIVVAVTMGAALTALANALPTAKAVGVRLLGENAIIVP